MSSIIVLIVLILITAFAFYKILTPMSKSGLTMIKDNKFTNMKGQYYTKANTAMLEDYFFNKPEVKQQLDGFQRLYMRETIMALWEGKRPPNSVGGYGILTKKKLIIEWNDSWQAEMDKLSEYHDISYKILFDIPEEHPPVTILLTADEIAEQYGREKEKS